MADVIVASGSTDDGSSAPRKHFEAPAVEDLGDLQELTLLQGVSF